MKTINKLVLVFLVIIFTLSCRKVDVPTPISQEPNAELKINSVSGLKLQSAFVTSEVAMNVKSEVSQSVTIKIFDIANRVVSKETMNVSVGDNILKVYTNALPSSGYRIGVYDSNGRELGITDFNKI